MLPPRRTRGTAVDEYKNKRPLTADYADFADCPLIKEGASTIRAVDFAETLKPVLPP
jgi:hypothetical protein